ncbi:hypothetical protein [Tumebacillus permanentifrigoris]|uniref:hypothetical protein n=1 Tax=Tumebacillus permanentifrigoris TaxID=378543 RepID=UPI0011B29CB2|nr:hypothetical protein [Tumebacillus permanentifrigoris]
MTPDLSELPARVKKVIEAPAHEQVAAGIEDARIEDARVELPETPLEPKPNELVFYQTLQAVQEQATALAVAHPAVPVTVNTRKGLPRWVWMVLAGSLVINLGAGYLVYKYRKDNATPAAKPAATPAVTPAAQAAAVAALTPQQQEALKQLAAQQAADTVPIVRQEVAWSLEQKEALSKGERTRIESVLSTVKKPDDFKNGSFNFVFVTGVNQVQAVHGGGAIVSAFVSNGYLKGYSPKLIKLNVYYGAQLILSGAYNEKLSQWAPNDVYMIQFAFTPNDIRDAAVLDKVSKSPTEQTKLRFEARIAFDQASNKPGAEKEEKWELMNTHTDVPVIKK